MITKMIHLMLSFLTVCKCYHFCVIIFPCTAWVLSFMLSFNVIIFCYHFPPFFFFLKTWHTPKAGTAVRTIYCTAQVWLGTILAWKIAKLVQGRLNITGEMGMLRLFLAHVCGLFIQSRCIKLDHIIKGARSYLDLNFY